jgi:hypothetical protein
VVLVAAALTGLACRFLPTGVALLLASVATLISLWPPLTPDQAPEVAEANPAGGTT